MKNFYKQASWNLKALFKNDSDPLMLKKRKIIETESSAFAKKWRNRRDYMKNPKILKQAMDDYEHFQRHYGSNSSEWYYFYLRTSQDSNDPVLKAKFNQARDFSNKIQNEIRFFKLNLSKILPINQKKMLKSPDLADYRHYLERSFALSKYLLSEPEEKIINLKFAPAHANWVKMTTGFLAKEEREVLNENGKLKIKSFSEIISQMDNQRKKVRDSAAKVVNDILRKYVPVAEAEINSVLADKKVDDELRKMPRPDLGRHLSDDLESKIVDELIKAVSGRFDISRKYYQLKASLMGVSRIEYHERNVSYGKIDKTYKFKEAADLTCKVFNGLDHKFADILLKFLTNGQVDIYPKKNKKNGAFCMYNLLTEPTFVMLNYTDVLANILTLAHEFGHAINDELMKEKQNALNFGSSLATAEVASTFMEDFILEEISKQADDELKLALLMMKLNRNMSTIFRQIACYKFEQELHRLFRAKGYLAKEEIGNLFQKHMSAYMGPAVFQSAGSENWWVYWEHIRNFFYNYSYASGQLISLYLQKQVKNNPAFINKVKEFLSAGQSASPKEIFKKLGINIADKRFWELGLQEINNLFNETKALAKKLKKIK